MTPSVPLRGIRLRALVLGWLAAAGLVITAVPASGQTNLLANSGFDGSLAPWSATGAATWVPAGGNSSPGAASCTDPSSCQFSQCRNLTPLVHPQAFDYGIALTHGGDTGTLALAAIVFPNASCSGFGQTVDFVNIFFPLQAWTLHTSGFDTFVDTRSVLVSFTAAAVFGGPPVDALLDDATLEATSGPIFIDGFGTGDTSAWSSTNP
jgi:hypothetical protein